jgi:hypothetical protein
MTLQRLSDFLPLAVQSLTQPRVTLRRVLSIPATRSDLLTAGWLVIVFSLLFSAIIAIILPQSETGTAQQPTFAAGVIIAALSLFGGAFVLHRVGRYFGGKGTFDQSLTTIIWLNFILMFLQIPVPFAATQSREIFGLVMMLVVIVGMVQSTAQVMELHGFTKVIPVLLAIVGAQFVFGVLIIILLSLMGITLPTEPVN